MRDLTDIQNGRTATRFAQRLLAAKRVERSMLAAAATAAVAKLKPEVKVEESTSSPSVVTERRRRPTGEPDRASGSTVGSNAGGRKVEFTPTRGYRAANPNSTPALMPTKASTIATPIKSTATESISRNQTRSINTSSLSSFLYSSTTTKLPKASVPPPAVEPVGQHTTSTSPTTVSSPQPNSSSLLPNEPAPTNHKDTTNQTTTPILKALIAVGIVIYYHYPSEPPRSNLFCMLLSLILGGGVRKETGAALSEREKIEWFCPAFH